MTSLSEEEENYVRMGLLLTGISPRAVRAFFDQEFAPSRLQSSLNKEQNKLQDLKKKRIINTHQWNLLFPRMHDSNTFDVTLIITLLRNLTDLQPPHGGFDSLPTASETTTGSDLARIKYYRNYLAHLNDAKIDNLFFLFAWADISEAIGRLGGQSLKQECHMLKTKTLDQTNKEIIQEIKHSQGEIEELKQSLEDLKISHKKDQEKNITTQKELMTEIDKLKIDKNEVIPKNIRAQTDIQIEDWKKSDQMFVSTRASDYVMKCLQENSCVTLTGPSGVGKSFIARHTALLMEEDGYKIIPVRKPDNIEDYYQPDKQTVFIVDDICGNFTANQHQIANWEQLLLVINRIIADKCCKIIVSCRLQVYKDDKFNRLSPFKSCECNLISDALCLTSLEKKKIADMYIGPKSQLLNDVAMQCEFFPLLCYLYHEQTDIKTNVNEFFGHPFVIYQAELDNLTRHGNEGNYKLCSLALCVIFNNRLEEKWFQGKVTDQQRQIIEDACDACKLNRSTSKAQLKESLDTLEGTFIRKFDSVYRTLHNKLFDFLAHYFSKTMIECLIEHGCIKLLQERFVLQKYQSEILYKFFLIEFLIEITDSYLESYFKRLIKDWSKGMVIFVFEDKHMEVSSFRQHLLHYLRRLDESEQKALINTGTPDWYKIRSESTKELGEYPLIRACKHGYADLVQWILQNDVDVNQCKNDGVTALFITCQKGHTTILNNLLEKNPNVNLCNNIGESSLYKACQNHTSIVKLLPFEKKYETYHTLMSNAEQNVQYYLRNKPGHNDEKWSYGYTKMIDYGFWVVAGSSPLHVACFMGWIDIVRCLLDHNANIDMTNEDSATPLSYACELGHTDIVKLLLEKRPNVDSRDNNGFTPLLKSCLNNHTSIVKLLLEHKPDIHARTFIGANALYFSALAGNLEIAQLLLVHNADCNIPIYSKDHWDIPINSKDCWDHIFTIPSKKSSAFEKKYETYHTLMSNAERNVQDYVRNIPGHYERETSEGYFKMIDYAIDVVAGSSPLHIACFMGRIDIVRCLLEHSANINMTKEDGATPLSYACEVGHNDIVQLLLEKRPNVDSRDNNGFTPLLKSCLNNHTSIVKLLLEHKPDINARTFTGANALYCSILNGNLEITHLLLENNVDCNVCIHSKECTISTSTDDARISLEQQKLNIFYTLMKTAQLNVKKRVRAKTLFYESEELDEFDRASIFFNDKSRSIDYVFEVVAGSFPLHIACFMGRIDIVRCLLDHNANINMTNEDGVTPLSYACEIGHEDIVQLLLATNPNVDPCDNDGFTPLIKACFNNNTRSVQLLVKYKSDINSRTFKGYNALFFSALNGNLEITQLLLENGAYCTICEERIQHEFANNARKSLVQNQLDIYHNIMTYALSNVKRYINMKSCGSVDYDKIKSKNYVFNVVAGSSPFHIACFMGWTDVARVLLKHNANIDMTKKDGTTPLFYACEVGHEDIVRLLLDKGAKTQICRIDGKSPLNFATDNGHKSVVLVLTKHAEDRYSVS